MRGIVDRGLGEAWIDTNTWRGERLYRRHARLGDEVMVGDDASRIKVGGPPFGVVRLSGSSEDMVKFGEMLRRRVLGE